MKIHFMIKKSSEFFFGKQSKRTTKKLQNYEFSIHKFRLPVNRGILEVWRAILMEIFLKFFKKSSQYVAILLQNWKMLPLVEIKVAKTWTLIIKDTKFHNFAEKNRSEITKSQIWSNFLKQNPLKSQKLALFSPNLSNRLPSYGTNKSHITYMTT